MLEESVIIDSGFVVSKFLNVLRSQFFAINCWRDGKQAIGMRMSCNKNIRTRVEQIPLEATRWRVVLHVTYLFSPFYFPSQWLCISLSMSILFCTLVGSRKIPRCRNSP